MVRTPQARAPEGGGGVLVTATALGVVLTLAAFAALVVAGVNIGDAFASNGDVARHTGVYRSVTAWAVPLGLLGITTLFGAAIPVGLARVRDGIHLRRDALVESLPLLVNPR